MSAMFTKLFTLSSMIITIILVHHSLCNPGLLQIHLVKLLEAFLIHIARDPDSCEEAGESSGRVGTWIISTSVFGRGKGGNKPLEYPIRTILSPS
jgi:hypothetical protein